MIERRRAPRHVCSLGVKYTTQGVVSIESNTVSRNISKIGIRIPVSRIVKRGDYIRLDIELNDKKGSIFVMGRVVWTKNFDYQSPLQWDAGIKFTEIDPFDTERLLQAVAS